MKRLPLILAVITAIGCSQTLKPQLMWKIGPYEIQTYLTENPEAKDANEMHQALNDIRKYGGVYDPNLAMVTGHPEYEVLAEVFYANDNVQHGTKRNTNNNE